VGETVTLFTLPESGRISRSAITSPDGVYRYSLTRVWDASLPHDLWIMCNSSTANHEIDDPSVRRCMGFSRRFGSGGFAIVNAYAFKATKPADMWAAEAAGVDIVGPENDGWIKAHLMTEQGRVIAAWGSHPKLDRVAQVIKIIRAEGREPVCLGTTKDGSPRHPLMLRNDASMDGWVGR